MRTRRGTSATSLSGSVQQNMRYISDLRRKIGKLEKEAAELSQRLNMLLVDLDGTRAKNNYLRLFVQGSEHQLQLQYDLNLSLQEEIKHLRKLTAIEPYRVGFNLVEPEQSTSQSGIGILLQLIMTKRGLRSLKESKKYD